MLPEQIQTQACPKRAAPPPANTANEQQLKSRIGGTTKAPCLTLAEQAGEQERSICSHARLPKGDERIIHTRVTHHTATQLLPTPQDFTEH